MWWNDIVIGARRSIHRPLLERLFPIGSLVPRERDETHPLVSFDLDEHTSLWRPISRVVGTSNLLCAVATEVMYDRSRATAIEVVDRWEYGISWMAHPDERAQRASHAIAGDDGVWVFDPLDCPKVDEQIAALGSVAGVAVLSDYHSRDAAAFAERHDVAVHIPLWMDHAATQVNAPITRYSAPPGGWIELGDSGIEIWTIDPPTAPREAIAYQPLDATLYVPNILSSAPYMTVGTERVGWHFFNRIAPPRDVFANIEPERLLFGHGEGVSENAAAALEAALTDARRNLPRSVVYQAPTQIRGIIGALFG